MSFCSLKEVNSALLQFLNTQLQSLHLQIKKGPMLENLMCLLNYSLKLRLINYYVSGISQSISDRIIPLSTI